MFNACRRGPASISRIVKTASVLTSPAFRSSILHFTERNVSKSAAATRSLTISSDARYNIGARTRPILVEDEIEPSQNDGPVYTKFQDLADSGLVHPAVIREITHGMGHETMTPVQTMTINETLKGRDT
jgi:ATP-dependent RNA helicase MSS116, mitochondrial